MILSKCQELGLNCKSYENSLTTLKRLDKEIRLRNANYKKVQDYANRYNLYIKPFKLKGSRNELWKRELKRLKARIYYRSKAGKPTEDFKELKDEEKITQE